MFILVAATACGGGQKTTQPPTSATGTIEAAAPDEPLGQPCTSRMVAMPQTDESTFGPLEVGADWQTYRKVSKHPFPSKTHGGRMVEVYVDELGYAAYTGEADFPVGATIVKTSAEKGGKPGPIFVMRKEAAGYNPDHGDWYYAIHWAEPTEKQRKLLGGPIYWRGESPKVEYCWKCHDNYDREIGGILPDDRAW